MTEKSKLHGGAERMTVRWANIDSPPFTISRYRVEVGAEVTLHVHTGKNEYWLVVHGCGVATVGDEKVDVAEGDVIATPAGVPHSLRNTGQTHLDFINVVEPTGEQVSTTELG